MKRQRRTLILVGGLASAVACQNEQGINGLRFENVAVASGDFDRVEEVLARNDVRYTLFEGYIEQPVYEDDVDPSGIAIGTEVLFGGTNADGDPEIYSYDAVFVNSGTRGFGSYAYNSLEPDDEIVSNDETISTVVDFVSTNRTLVVSDWAYDLVEAGWPDHIVFLGEEDGLDEAQVGLDESVIADVVDEGLAEVLLNDQLQIDFDFSYWTVMESVSDDVEVYLRGDVEYRLSDNTGTATLEDVPLLVAFDAGRGRVIYSAFSWKAQSQSVTDLLLLYLAQGLDVETSHTEASD
jgi:hypothetical protein